MRTPVTFKLSKKPMVNKHSKQHNNAKSAPNTVNQKEPSMKNKEMTLRAQSAITDYIAVRGGNNQYELIERFGDELEKRERNYKNRISVNANPDCVRMQV